MRRRRPCGRRSVTGDLRHGVFLVALCLQVPPFPSMRPTAGDLVKWAQEYQASLPNASSELELDQDFSEAAPAPEEDAAEAAEAPGAVEAPGVEQAPGAALAPGAEQVPGAALEPGAEQACTVSPKPEVKRGMAVINSYPTTCNSIQYPNDCDEYYECVGDVCHPCISGVLEHCIPLPAACTKPQEEEKVLAQLCPNEIFQQCTSGDQCPESMECVQGGTGCKCIEETQCLWQGNCTDKASMANMCSKELKSGGLCKGDTECAIEDVCVDLEAEELHPFRGEANEMERQRQIDDEMAIQGSRMAFLLNMFMEGGEAQTVTKVDMARELGFNDQEINYELTKAGFNKHLGTHKVIKVAKKSFDAGHNYNCQDGLPDAWSEKKASHCCAVQKVGCDLLEKDMKAVVGGAPLGVDKVGTEIAEADENSQAALEADVYDEVLAPLAYAGAQPWGIKNCEDTDGGALDAWGDGCSWYTARQGRECGDHDSLDFNANGMCCACGGGGTSNDGPMCADTCEPMEMIANGVCEDGGLRSASGRCAYGTDCSDCGPRGEKSATADWDDFLRVANGRTLFKRRKNVKFDKGMDCCPIPAIDFEITVRVGVEHYEHMMDKQDEFRMQVERGEWFMPEKMSEILAPGGGEEDADALAKAALQREQLVKERMHFTEIRGACALGKSELETDEGQVNMIMIDSKSRCEFECGMSPNCYAYEWCFMKFTCNHYYGSDIRSADKRYRKNYVCGINNRILAADAVPKPSVAKEEIFKVFRGACATDGLKAKRNAGVYAGVNAFSVGNCQAQCRQQKGCAAYQWCDEKDECKHFMGIPVDGADPKFRVHYICGINMEFAQALSDLDKSTESSYSGDSVSDNVDPNAMDPARQSDEDFKVYDGACSESKNGMETDRGQILQADIEDASMCRSRCKDTVLCAAWQWCSPRMQCKFYLAVKIRGADQTYTKNYVCGIKKWYGQEQMNSIEDEVQPEQEFGQRARDETEFTAVVTMKSNCDMFGLTLSDSTGVIKMVNTHPSFLVGAWNLRDASEESDVETYAIPMERQTSQFGISGATVVVNVSKSEEERLGPKSAITIPQKVGKGGKGGKDSKGGKGGKGGGGAKKLKIKEGQFVQRVCIVEPGRARFCSRQPDVEGIIEKLKYRGYGVCPCCLHDERFFPGAVKKDFRDWFPKNESEEEVDPHVGILSSKRIFLSQFGNDGDAIPGEEPVEGEEGAAAEEVQPPGGEEGAAAGEIQPPGAPAKTDGVPVDAEGAPMSEDQMKEAEAEQEIAALP
eukprot:TRINITY_DN998_c1_g1_i1.p1 TRINITY_DN998_c1_g1~~TRINITY_DN998_c1_g1_i1.p1  ORF type:complete len:1275 (-),score=342.80 TRINITY_DN998_c1_g1_i1:131-3955(-)